MYVGTPMIIINKNLNYFNRVDLGPSSCYLRMFLFEFAVAK